MKARRRVLVVSPMGTHPPWSGNARRLKSIMDFLRRSNFDLHLAHLRLFPGNQDAMAAHWGPAAVSSIGYRRESWIESGGTLNPRFRPLLFLRQRLGLPLAIDDWYDARAAEELAPIVASFQPEFALVNYVFLSRFFELFAPSATKILDTHDVFTGRHKLFQRLGLKPDFFYTTARQESRGLDRADCVWAIQEKDRRRLEGMTSRRVVTVGHLVDVRPPVAISSSDPSLLFVGSSNSANVDGLTHFLRQVYPTVQKGFPAVGLKVAGSVVERLPGELQRNPPAGVEILGVVEDLGSLYAQVSVVICPLRFGTGLKVKILEAMGLGKPVVTTTSGGEGLEEASPTALRVAGDDEALAETLIEVLRSERLRRSMSEAAVGFAADWNRRQERELRAVFDMDAPASGLKSGG